MPFEPVSPDASFTEREVRILDHWAQTRAFERSVEQHPVEKAYIFYDGPPFATGVPHYGHLVASTLKDIVPRYWTMRGYRVERRFGWDTHGLPIENLTEEKLNLNSPSEIRAYGVDRFNEACRSGVLAYTEEWRRVIGRLGRWVDFDNDYKTMDATFMESVWWVFKQLWDKGLVYQDFKVMPYSWRLSTSLSNFEAGSNYQEVQDPAITVKMPTVDQQGEVLLIWTTTPWTLPSNLAIAVGEELDYVRARKVGDNTVYVVAQDLMTDVLGKEAEMVGEPFKGSELVGWRYAPLFDYFVQERGEVAYRVIAADHVTTKDGTGLVHMAPDFGEEDFLASKAEGIEVVLSVDDEGRFEPSIRDFAGRHVKEADSDIIRTLKDKGRMFRHSTLMHSYPFCPRSDTPLINRAMPSWFVRVTELRDRMVEHNKGIHWVPEPVGAGRFANWLADARDWNISRNRFWGTPMPLWFCSTCDTYQCIGSIAELEELSGAEVDDLHPHRIDHLKVPCEACGGEAKRISDVFDCWFESGSMPYAQLHYPFENRELFEATFPAKFIAEGLDQTRGWFYTLMVLSTALFDDKPFENCVVNGMVLNKDAKKMSKRLQNYPPVDEVLSAYGADALRAYLIDSPVVRAEPLRFNKDGVRDVVRTVLIPLQNAWSFFVQYANIDGWEPGGEAPPLEARAELDRWLLSTLQSLIRKVDAEMELYHLYNVVPVVLSFIDDLTNLYIRLSRRRFWRTAETEADKLDKDAAYATLHEVLLTFSKVLAPFLPFISEALYQGLSGELDSVHLCAWPMVKDAYIDLDLERRVALARRVVTMGRRLRERHQLKTRQPLPRLTLVHHDEQARADLEQMASKVAEELNVKTVQITADGDHLATVSCKPNYKRLGRRFGKKMRDAASVIGAFTTAQWRQLEEGGTIDVFGEDVAAEDIEVRRDPRGDVVIETEGGLIVALDTDLSKALLQEGMAREVTSWVQRQRKEQELAITDRIALTLISPDAELRDAITSESQSIADEVLALSIGVEEGEGLETISTVGGEWSLAARIDVVGAP
ncbi:MAG: isoleucine--tRNA ligase [Myxococcota bacterium]